MANLIPLRPCLTIAEALVAAAGLADVVSMETNDWTGSGVTNGWRYASLGTPFSDGAARFGDGAVIVSPTWPRAEILNAAITLRCSTCCPDRFLAISFLKDGTVVSGPMKAQPVGRDNVPETQTFAVSRKKRANGVRVSLGTGSSGDWGVYRVCLAYAGETTARRQGLAIIVK